MSGPGRTMRGLAARASSGRDGERRVLVLQGELAVWTYWLGGHRTAVHVERLADDASAACTCPWPAIAGETFVDVVADSPLDELERVLASGDASVSGGATVSRAVGARAPAAPTSDARTPPLRLPGALSRWRLRRRLARRHPGAAVHVPPADAWPLLASLSRAELPDDWRRRLETLQRGPVTIVSLCPAIRLRTAAPEDRFGDVLQVTRGGGVERHLLLRSGCPTFTRVVSAADPDGSREALEETLAHLAVRHGVIAPRERHPPSVPEPSAAAPGGSDSCVSDSSGLDDAHRLAARSIEASRKGRRRSDVPAARTDEPLLGKRRRHVELRRLHVATALTSAIAASTVLASAVHGIDSARRRAHAIDAEEALSLRVERLIEAVADRHANPSRADASLALLERHEASRAPAAEAVLGTLARALTVHAAVRLDRIEWSTPEGADATGDGRPEAAASQPLRRVRREDAVEAPAIAVVELTGRIDAAGALSVRERQRRFEAFVASLERDAGVASLRVRLSPAIAAATGDGGTGTVSSNEYALQMRHEGSR